MVLKLLSMVLYERDALLALSLEVPVALSKVCACCAGWRVVGAFVRRLAQCRVQGPNAFICLIIFILSASSAYSSSFHLQLRRRQHWQMLRPLDEVAMSSTSLAVDRCGVPGRFVGGGPCFFVWLSLCLTPSMSRRLVELVVNHTFSIPLGSVVRVGADVTCPDLGHVTCCKRFVETGCGLYLDPKWLSRFMFSSWGSRRILFGAKGELIAESRATARRREENVFGVLDLWAG